MTNPITMKNKLYDFFIKHSRYLVLLIFAIPFFGIASLETKNEFWIQAAAAVVMMLCCTVLLFLVVESINRSTKRDKERLQMMQSNNKELNSAVLWMQSNNKELNLNNKELSSAVLRMQSAVLRMQSRLKYKKTHGKVSDLINLAIDALAEPLPAPSMTNNPGKQIRLDEGHVQRGNVGQGPRTPKPEITPKGQGTKGNK